MQSLYLSCLLSPLVYRQAYKIVEFDFVVTQCDNVERKELGLKLSLTTGNVNKSSIFSLGILCTLSLESFPSFLHGCCFFIFKQLF